jgi:hypothetical protein
MARYIPLIGALLLCSCHQQAAADFNTDNIDAAFAEEPDLKNEVSAPLSNNLAPSVVSQCDTHAEMERSLRADGYRLAERRPGVDIYRLVRVIGVTGAGAEDVQIVHRRGSQDCIDIEQVEETH